MRRLMWFTLGFAAVCALFAYAMPAAIAAPVSLGALALSVAAGIAGRKAGFFRRCALVLLGCALGSAWFGCFFSRSLAVPGALEGKTETVTIRTTDYSERTDYGIVAEGLLELEGSSCRVRVWLDRKEPLGPGYRITAPFRFASTAPREKPVSYYSGTGIFLLAFQEGDGIILEDREVLWQDRIAGLRRWLQEAIHSCFPEDTEAFARALLLGDTSLMSYEMDTNFKVSGIRHVVAVSGLHVSVLMGLLAMVTFRKKYLTVPLGIVMLLLFAALAGFTPSVTRSCLMSGLMLLALLFDREYDGATALSFAVLVMLLGNPLVIASVSFQLSAASVAGIFLFTPGIRTWLDKLLPDPGKRKSWARARGGLCTATAVTWGAMSLTTPLCAGYFGMISLVGVITNLLALWVVSGIFCGVMAVCLLCIVWEPAAVLLARLVAWPVRYVQWIARILADVPMAAVYMDSVYTAVWLGFVYILLGVFLLQRKRRPGQLLCCGILSLCIALLASWSGREETRITVLDVGQGQCILLEQDGMTCMVDCGGDSDAHAADIAANHLLSRGINRLDCLVLTHLDRDHAGAAENFLSRMDTQLLILPAEPTTLAGRKTVFAEQDLLLQFGGGNIHVYTPTYPGAGNEKSLCVLFETENCDILITGDRDAFGERMLLRNAEIPEVDILIAGHHGSKHSTCEDLLDRISPEIVCISAGRENPYGHPDPELLERLARYGCTVYRTDRHGTITIRR